MMSLDMDSSWRIARIATALIAVGKMANGQLSDPSPPALHPDPTPHSLRPLRAGGAAGGQTSHN